MKGRSGGKRKGAREGPLNRNAWVLPAEIIGQADTDHVDVVE